MTTLLCTTGQSPAVVLEAYLLCDPLPDAVHCLTTDSEKTPVGLLHAFFAEEGVQFSCTRVAGLADLRNGDDQALFDEVLFRWFLRHRAENETLLVCLAGGFKTMSASTQQAAAYFGAEAVFHVLAPTNPTDAESVRAALASGDLHRIELEPSHGWLPLRRLRTSDFPLSGQLAAENESLATASPGESLRDIIAAETARVFSGGVGSEPPPFPSLSLRTAPERAWLRGPLDPESDAAWVRALPKVELHCHLGGFATHGASLEKVRSAAAEPDSLPAARNPDSPAGWPLPAECLPLDVYMALGNATGSTLLRDPGCLRRHCELLYGHLVAENVVYAEIRCSPNNYASEGRSAWDVLTDIRGIFDACMDAAGHACHINLIVIATRKPGGDLSDISRHLALAVTAADSARAERCDVVGVDLAGFENVATRPAYFASDFRGIHRCGLSTTVHAGENDDVEGIWQAVYELKADRIGHGLRLSESPDLLRVVARKRVAVELCPYANVQIVGFAPFTHAERAYPLRVYLDAGLRVTINTDNIGISGASLTANLLLAARLCPPDAPLLRDEILALQRNAVEAAFVAPRFRSGLLNRIDRLLSEMP